VQVYAEVPGQLVIVEAMDEVAVGIRNEMGRMQWQHSMARLAAYMQSNGAHFEHVLQ
jgi:hypothetical protein